MATTVRNLIENALRKISVGGVGETVSSEEAADALRELNSMLDNWSIEGGLIYNETIETFPLTGAASYTIGAGADFDTAKPYEITAMYVSQGSTDYPLENYDQKQYSLITNKTIGGIPDIYYYNNNFPTATIFLYPVPSNVTSVTIYSNKPLGNFTSINDTVTLPKGYEEAIVYNLAIRLAPDYEKVPTQLVIDIAKVSKGNVFTSNERNENNVSYVDAALLTRSNYNIYEG